MEEVTKMLINGEIIYIIIFHPLLLLLIAFYILFDIRDVVHILFYRMVIVYFDLMLDESSSIL